MLTLGIDALVEESQMDDERKSQNGEIDWLELKYINS